MGQQPQVVTKGNKRAHVPVYLIFLSMPALIHVSVPSDGELQKDMASLLHHVHRAKQTIHAASLSSKVVLKM